MPQGRYCKAILDDDENGNNHQNQNNQVVNSGSADISLEQNNLSSDRSLDVESITARIMSIQDPNILNSVLSIIPSSDQKKKISSADLLFKSSSSPESTVQSTITSMAGSEAFIVPKITVTRPSLSGISNPSSESGSVSHSISSWKLGLRPFKGILFAVLSSIFFSVTAVIVKYLKDIHPGEMACFRFLGILLFTIPMVITANVNPFGPSEKRHFLILRGIAGATSIYLRYSALHYLPIANATIIVLSMPVFVCIFARIFLKESCGVFHVIAIGITLVGIGFTSKVGALIGLTDDEGIDKYKEIMGLSYSMGATLVGSSVYIFVRKVKECHNSVILFNFSVVAIIETSILTGIDGGFSIPHVGYAPWLLMLLAVLSFYAQLLLTKSLQLEEASLVSVTRSSSEVVCAFLFQIIIFGQMPDVYAIVGAILVTSSVLLTSARKWVMTLPSDHKARKILGFTLK